MVALGIDYADGSHVNVFHVHPMWDESDLDKRRMMIWQRQHDGAVKTLTGRL
jgi:hypothetical protein